MKITVQDGKGKREIPYQNEISLLQNIIEQQSELSSVCAGNGTCGKCKVRFLSGATKPTAEDKKTFTPMQLQQGYRLACKAYPGEDAIIQIAEKSEKDFSVVSEYLSIPRAKSADNRKSRFGMVIDLGTTTIVIQLVEIPTGKVLNTYTAINTQRRYGADVISRIKVSNDGKKEKLQECIRKDLQAGIADLLKDFSGFIEKIVIAGNTTMIHLLMGYSCETLGVYPFTPITTQTIETNYQELFLDETFAAPITILPAFSAFVGGDIVAGLLACNFSEKEKPNLFLDLGTNGEMAIGNRERIIVTSVAAGPAFEGGNIQCGTGSIPGGICNVKIEENRTQITTIANQKPIGICGTGVIAAIYEMLKNGFLDETGLLQESLFEEGFLLAQRNDGEKIVITQKDIREIQLAKAAVRAGIEILLLRSQTSYEEIDKLYLAGGFGYHLDIQKAVGIGLLPKELEKKVIIAGNTSLSGAIYYITQEEAKRKTKELRAKAAEINLSADKAFQENYFSQMHFEI